MAAAQDAESHARYLLLRSVRGPDAPSQAPLRRLSVADVLPSSCPPEGPRWRSPGSWAGLGQGSRGAAAAWFGGWASSFRGRSGSGGGGGADPAAGGDDVLDGRDGLVSVALPGKFGRGDGDGVEAAVVAMARRVFLSSTLQVRLVGEDGGKGRKEGDEEGRRGVCSVVHRCVPASFLGSWRCRPRATKCRAAAAPR